MDLTSIHLNKSDSMPELHEPDAELRGDTLQVTIHHDHDLEDPADNGDNNWKLYSFIDRHVNYKNHEEFFPPNIGLRKKLQVGLAFVLDYFEHGNCSWSRAGHGPQCPRQHGRRTGAGRPTAKRAAGPPTHAARLRCLQSARESCRAWSECVGDVTL